MAAAIGVTIAAAISG
ncbi:hypothetical protein YPPY47_0996, partial [Yersinia pestis PY-47]